MSRELTLITNINFVSLQSLRMRLECNALLISPADDSSLGKRFPELRGFGEESSSEIFSLPIETMEYQIADAHDPTKVVMQHEGGMHPLFQGALLKIDKYSFFLQAEDYRKPIHVEKLIGPSRKDFEEERAYYDANGEFYSKLWSTLHERVVQFWVAPYFPSKKYLPIEMVRLEIAKNGILEKLSKHDVIRAMLAIEVLRKKGDATLSEIRDAMLGLQSTDEPALNGFYDDLADLKKKLEKKRVK